MATKRKLQNYCINYEHHVKIQLKRPTMTWQKKKSQSDLLKPQMNYEDYNQSKAVGVISQQNQMLPHDPRF